MKNVQRYAGIVSLLLLISVPGAAGETGGERIRVATYNLENYNLTDRLVNGVYRFDYPKPESEKHALRRIITEIRPDVLAVQEIGPMPFLLELQRDLRREGIDYRHAALLEDADPVRKVAVLSRIPFREVKRHTDMSFLYFEDREMVRRGLLEVRFDTAGIEWALFTLHLKSKWTERPDDPRATRRRIAEAHTVRNRIRASFPETEGHAFLVAGDFNDTRGTAAVRRFLEVGGRPITAIVPAVDSRGETWTQFWEREEVYSRVDFILASPAMRPIIVPGSGRVVDLPQWREASDHRMVYVDLEFTVTEGAEELHPD